MMIRVRNVLVNMPPTTATPIGRLFAEGPIEILVARVCGQRVSLGIAAHAGFLIYRTEVGEGYLGGV